MRFLKSSELCVMFVIVSVVSVFTGNILNDQRRTLIFSAVLSLTFVTWVHESDLGKEQIRNAEDCPA